MLHVMLLCGICRVLLLDKLHARLLLWGVKVNRDSWLCGLLYCLKHHIETTEHFIMTCIGTLNSQILFVYYMPKKPLKCTSYMLHLHCALKYSIHYIFANALALYCA
jgi:hypothetical protein